MPYASSDEGGDGNGDGSAVGRFVFPFDSLTSKIHAIVFIRYRYASLAVAISIYAAICLVFGDGLAVSSNYFVIAPVMVAALGFGWRGGFLSGALALPANLLLFRILGHPEFSPASKLIAETSGIAVGLLCGRLADYFRELEQEIKRRIVSEEALRSALAEKKLLLRELHHRVKNNLSVIKSLVQLQRSRSKDPAFLEAADDLIGRIFAISLVHDQLNADHSLSIVEISKFIEALATNLADGLGLEDSGISLELRTGDRFIQIEAATSLGLIVNEILTNSLKHASSLGEKKPSIRLDLLLEGDDYRLTIIDDGPGPAAKRGAEGSGGLGMKLVRALARNLGGEATLEAIEESQGGGPVVRGTRFELVFPATFMELVETGQASPM
jgi:two-component sensor histidine kinase